MYIDLKPILSGKTDTIEFDYKLPALEGFNGIEFPEEVSVKGVIRDHAGYITLQASASVPYITACARCMKEIEGVFDHTFSRTLATKLQKEENDEYLMIRENRVDLDTPLLEDLILNFDFIYLCREDCKGLCPKCGHDLNESDCGCASKKEIDPRLAILAKLLDK